MKNNKIYRLFCVPLAASLFLISSAQAENTDDGLVVTETVTNESVEESVLEEYKELDKLKKNDSSSETRYEYMKKNCKNFNKKNGKIERPKSNSNQKCIKAYKSHVKGLKRASFCKDPNSLKLPQSIEKNEAQQILKLIQQRCSNAASESDEF